MERACRRLGVSERRACRVLGQARGSQRYRRREAADAGRLVERMRELSGRHPRYGYRRIAALLRREGRAVNVKRVHRLWTAEGLKVPRKQHRKRRLGSPANGCTRRRAERKDQVWSYDFVEDRTENGRRLKLLTVVDEFTRECLTIEADREMTSEDVVRTLDYLFAVRGAPEHIRSDNGPEFTARKVRRWLSASGVGTLYIQRASPWENAYVESFNGKLRDELLNRELFLSLAEARYVIDEWRLEYNRRRPHSALGYRTPAAFAAACCGAGSAALRPPRNTLEQRTKLS